MVWMGHVISLLGVAYELLSAYTMSWGHTPRARAGNVIVQPP